VYGLAVNDVRTFLPLENFPMRLVSLSDHSRLEPLSAAYWFQSPDRVTDDYSERIWQDLFSQHERWVLVSILFDQVRDPGVPDVQAFYLALRDAVARGLGE
jgi:hypothetical protein